MENNDSISELLNKNSDLEYLNLDMKMKQYLGIYSFELIPVAEELYEYFSSKENKKLNNIYYIDFADLKNLLVIIGIKKNKHEILEKIENIRAYKPKSFFFENKYTKENFIDIVKSFADYRIEEKILVQIFNEIDSDAEGYIDIKKVKDLCLKMKLNLTDQEIQDMLTLGAVGSKKQEGDKIDYEMFCKLFYKK
jgi:Ca2+-binding EF-hand superfamily protein